MAEITFKFDFPENCSYGISIGKTEKTIDESRPNVSFTLENGEHEVLIEQFFEPEASGVLWKILSIATMPITGIFAFDTDTDWEKNVCAYGLRSILKINVLGDAEYEIKLENSSFSCQTWSFSMPRAICPENVTVENGCWEHPDGIDIAFRKYVRKIYSPISWFLVLWALLLYNIVFNGREFSGLWLFFGVTVFVFAVSIFVNVINIKRKKEIYRIFVQTKNN